MNMACHQKEGNTDCPGPGNIHCFHEKEMMFVKCSSDSEKYKYIVSGWEFSKILHQDEGIQCFLKKQMHIIPI